MQGGAAVAMTGLKKPTRMLAVLLSRPIPQHLQPLAVPHRQQRPPRNALLDVCVHAAVWDECMPRDVGHIGTQKLNARLDRSHAVRQGSVGVETGEQVASATMTTTWH